MTWCVVCVRYVSVWLVIIVRAYHKYDNIVGYRYGTSCKNRGLELSKSQTIRLNLKIAIFFFFLDFVY